MQGSLQCNLHRVVRLLAMAGGSLPRRLSHSSTATEWVDDAATDVAWQLAHIRIYLRGPPLRVSYISFRISVLSLVQNDTVNVGKIVI